MEIDVDAHGHISKQKHDHVATPAPKEPKPTQKSKHHGAPTAEHKAAPVERKKDHQKLYGDTDHTTDAHEILHKMRPKLQGAAHLDAPPAPEEKHHKKPVETAHAKVAEAMPASHEQHKKREVQKLSPKEIEDLRVKHGIAYEKEHDVDHYIDAETHPQYEITGYVKEDQDAYHHMMHRYMQDHEEEHYGDEHEHDKAHLHLHPTHKAHYQARDDHHVHHPVEHRVHHEEKVHHDDFWYGGDYPHHVEERPGEHEQWVEVDHSQHHYSAEPRYHEHEHFVREQPVHHVYHEEPVRHVYHEKHVYEEEPVHHYQHEDVHYDY